MHFPTSAPPLPPGSPPTTRALPTRGHKSLAPFERGKGVCESRRRQVIDEAIFALALALAVPLALALTEALTVALTNTPTLTLAHS